MPPEGDKLSSDQIAVLKRWIEGEPIYADPDIRQRRSQRVPLQRLGSGADVANAVLFLMSDAASYINGTELIVDGGVAMSVIATLPRPVAVDSVGVAPTHP